jgi:hypothetical protein
MRFVTVILAIALSAAVSYGQTSSCPCDTTKGNHLRKGVKNRPIPSSVHAKRTVKMREMMRVWDITNDEFEREPAHTYPREDTVFTVVGYLHRTNIASDDCDFHIEIASSKAHGAKHIIVEIPNTQEYCALRQQFLNGVIGKEKVVNGVTSTIDKIGTTAIIFKNPPRVTVTGYAFLDTGHWSAADHHRGNGSHGSEYVSSLWELHPVIDITVE